MWLVYIVFAVPVLVIACMVAVRRPRFGYLTGIAALVEAGRNLPHKSAWWAPADTNLEIAICLGFAIGGVVLSVVALYGSYRQVRSLLGAGRAVPFAQLRDRRI